MAEADGDMERLAALQKEVEETKKDWEENFDSKLEGWTALEKMRATALDLSEKLKDNPDLLKEIDIPKGWDFPWNDYFTQSPSQEVWDARLKDDLASLLVQLDCMEAEGVKYVAIVGG